MAIKRYRSRRTKTKRTKRTRRTKRTKRTRRRITKKRTRRTTRRTKRTSRSSRRRTRQRITYQRRVSKRRTNKRKQKGGITAERVDSAQLLREKALMAEINTGAPMGKLLADKAEAVAQEKARDLRAAEHPLSEDHLKNRKYLRLGELFSSKSLETLYTTTDDVKWDLVIDVVKMMYECAANDSFFHNHKPEEQFATVHGNHVDLSLFLNRVKNVAESRKHSDSKTIYPYHIHKLMKELLHHLGVEIKHRDKNRKNKSLMIDELYFPQFRYILLWFGQKLLACSLHLCITLETNSIYKINTQAAEDKLLSAIDTLIAIPITSTLGSITGNPIKVQKKITKVLDHILRDKAIGLILKGRKLDFVNGVEDLYERFIKLFDSRIQGDPQHTADFYEHEVVLQTLRGAA